MRSGLVISIKMSLRAPIIGLRTIYLAFFVGLLHVKKLVLPNEGRWKERIMLAKKRRYQQTTNKIMRILFHYWGNPLAVGLHLVDMGVRLILI